ncbi:SPOR domain-containing protein [Microbacterium cremeum]|uniref:SPOR domain-containing protein n=1 Tax=Microbacterium cremeum TaxID=2782169 RepID=UPI0018879EA4|nr:SPOR domain-containing protein [Microbacterium cremeum]
MSGDSEKYWYNLKTGDVEKGYESPSVDRAGPFETPEEAARAPEIMRERSRAWAEDEARDDSWGDGESGKSTRDQ